METLSSIMEAVVILIMPHTINGIMPTNGLSHVALLSGVILLDNLAQQHSKWD